MHDKNSLIQRMQAIQTRVTALQLESKITTQKEEQTALQAQMSATGFWNDTEKAQTVTKRAAEIEKSIAQAETLLGAFEMIELIEMSTNEELEALAMEIDTLEILTEKAEVQQLFTGEYDIKDAILSLKVGNGGQDAEEFTQKLLRMYIRWAEQEGMSVTILDKSESDVGLRGATIEVSGAYAYGHLQAEHGVHRLIRLSPFNAKSLRQTSFAQVEVLPSLPEENALNIDPSDLRIDVFRSSGPGGQSVNTTDSAVRITYLPLGLTVSCQNEKSQQQNKAAAMRVLQSRLLQLQLEQRAETLSELRGEVMEASFGSQIRTYTLQPYKLVKDHRTDTEHTNPDKVFDGDITPFMTAYLRDLAQK